jgi:VCBS repeat-containing protein
MSTINTGYTIQATFNGDSAGANLGWSVAGAGDIDGDGVPDLIAGAPFDDQATLDAGSVRVFSGASGSAIYTFVGDSVSDFFGWSVAGAGDVNGDGVADIIVGAPGDDNNGTSSGSARVFSGADGSALYTFDGDAASDNFGWTVASAGDVNGDGHADLIVGASGNDTNGAESGTARVFSGIDGSVLFTFNGDSAGDRLGYSVAGAGDVDGDGVPDLIVGAYLDDNNGTDSGSARVFSGADGSVLYTFDGDSPADQFGFSVAGAGDVDGDGFADLIVGARGDDNNGTSSGSARVFSGATGAVLFTFNGDSSFDVFGVSVAGAGDVDGDGHADLVVGADSDDNNGTSSGSARVFSGADGSALYTFDGDSAQDRFGYSVAGAGDINGDGFADVLVGARGDDNTGLFESGSVRLFVSNAVAVTTANDDVFTGYPDAVIDTNDLLAVFNDAGFATTVTVDPATGFDVTLGDLDGDGDLDLFRARSGAGNEVYLNDGTGTLIDTGQALGANQSQASALGDLDGDGDLDAFVVNFGGQGDRVYLNDGAGSFTDSGQSLGSEFSLDVALGDFDGDGDLDAVTATASSGNRIWINDGSGAFTAGQVLSSTQSPDVAVADLDGDGDLDVFLTQSNINGASVYLNDGNGSFTELAQSFTVRFDPRVALGDIDNDGDIDAILTTHAGGDPNNPLADIVLTNDGTGVFTDTGQTLSTNTTTDVVLADADADGDLDALFGYRDGPLDRIFANDGNGTFTDTGQTIGDSATTSIAVGDLDQTGFSENGIHTLRVLDNDTDPDGDTLTITAVDATSANGAALTITNGGRTVTYDGTTAGAVQALNDGAFLNDTFTYTVSDGNGNTDTATVTVKIRGEDGYSLGDFAFLSTFATPAERATAFSTIESLLNAGQPSVTWQEGGATNVATIEAGTGNVIVTSTDPAGASGGLAMTSSTFTFDATSGNRISKVTVFDDGSIATRDFGDGTTDTLLSQTTTGIDGPQATSTIIFDSAGRWDSLEITYDAGGSTRYDYDDDGRIDTLTQSQANGVVSTSQYNDLNQRTSLTQVDNDDVFGGWQMSTETFDPATGQLVTKVVLGDDDNTTTSSYSGGVITSRVTTDTGGANEAWSSITTTFDASGAFDHVYHEYDNGTGIIQGSASGNTLTGGVDRVLDFVQGEDQLDLTAFGVSTTAEIQSTATAIDDSGPQLILDFGGGDTVQINGLDFVDLTNGDLF